MASQASVKVSYGKNISAVNLNRLRLSHDMRCSVRQFYCNPAVYCKKSEFSTLTLIRREPDQEKTLILKQTQNAMKIVLEVRELGELDELDELNELDESGKMGELGELGELDNWVNWVNWMN